MTTQAQGMTTGELNEALHAHFIRPEDRISEAGAGAVYLTEVTAPGSRCRADAVHVGLWENRGGGRIDVCELKVTRADWLRELEKPQKAEAWWPYCNAFWLVVPTSDIVRKGELPPGWGLMTPGGRGGRRFKVVTAPEEREPTLTTSLLRTLLTSTETTKVHALRQQQKKMRQGFDEQVQRIRRERSASTPEDRKRLAALDKLEDLLGLKVDDHAWDDQITPETAAEGLKAFMQGQAAMDAARRDTQWILRELDRAATGAREQAESIRKAMGIE